MTKFTPMQYLHIDIASTFGLGSKNWADRLLWTQYNMDTLEDQVSEAKEPLLYLKAVQALRVVQAGEKTGHLMSLDATSSNIQILAILSGCETAAKLCNVINTGNREDARAHLVTEMNTMLQGDDLISDRDVDTVKKALMTVLFNSKGEPKKLFGEDTPRFEAFYDSLEELFPGPLQAMDFINECWQSDVLSHDLVTPNGHHAKMKSMVKDSKRITLKELDNVSFTFETLVNQPSERNTPLVANITHNIDGYIVQEMHTRCHTDGIPLVTIHDCFQSSPVFMNEVRQHYIDINAEIADMNLLQNYARQLTGDKTLVVTPGKNLANDIRNSEYMLS